MTSYRMTYLNAAAVLLPIVDRDGVDCILFEHRAYTIDVQPGEVSFPGGGHEGRETIEETVIRETTEELCIAPEQIELLGQMDPVIGAGRSIWPFIGRIRDYKGTFSKEEVDHVFTVPIAYLKDYEPVTSYTKLKNVPAPDFPYDLIEGGRDYPWHEARTEMYFYAYENEMIWGLTGRILHAFLRQYVREGSAL